MVALHTPAQLSLRPVVFFKQLLVPVANLKVFSVDVGIQEISTCPLVLLHTSEQATDDNLTCPSPRIYHFIYPPRRQRGTSWCVLCKIHRTKSGCMEFSTEPAAVAGAINRPCRVPAKWYYRVISAVGLDSGCVLSVILR